MIDPSSFLEVVAQYGQQRAAKEPGGRTTKLATVDPTYATGAPKVTFDGTTNLSEGGFQFLPSYTPAAGDRVLMLPVGNSYVIAGPPATVPTPGGGGGEGGVTDHGLLTGLGDDDHPHYLNNTRGDVRYYTQAAMDTLLAGKQASDADLTTIAGLSPADGQVLRRVTGAWAASNLATVATTGAYADLTGKPTIPAAYTDEQVRDVVATALVAGTNVTITPDDVGDTITISSSGGGGGATDHGALTGLADDDHTQYHTDARGDVRYYTKAATDALLDDQPRMLGPYFTTTLTSTAAAAGPRSIASVTVPDPGFDWRPLCYGEAEISNDINGSRPSLKVRLSSATGTLYARGSGLAGGGNWSMAQASPYPVAAALAAGSSRTFHLVVENDYGTIWIQASTSFFPHLTVYVVPA